MEKGETKKILIVDDSKTERAILMSYLSGLDLAFFEASSGNEAIEKLDKIKPDLILMDILMANGDGFKTTRDIRKKERFNDVPIVICSSKKSKTDVFWAKQQGANEYIIKPVDKKELLFIVKKLLVV